jgi:hypothetical protein
MIILAAYNIPLIGAYYGNLRGLNDVEERLLSAVIMFVLTTSVAFARRQCTTDHPFCLSVMLRSWVLPF